MKKIGLPVAYDWLSVMVQILDSVQSTTRFHSVAPDFLWNGSECRMVYRISLSRRKSFLIWVQCSSGHTYRSYFITCNCKKHSRYGVDTNLSNKNKENKNFIELHLVYQWMDFFVVTLWPSSLIIEHRFDLRNIFNSLQKQNLNILTNLNTFGVSFHIFAELIVITV